MELFIENPNNANIADFMNWLCEEIEEFVAEKNLRIPKLEVIWDEALEESGLDWPKDELGNPVAPTTSFIINEYFTHLMVEEVNEGFRITVMPELYLRGSNLTIEFLAAYINNGNISTPAYRYFDDVFDTFADNLESMYLEYLNIFGDEYEEV